MNSEIVLNFWFYVDIATHLCGFWSVKPYILDGDDAKKTKLLKTLAENDYKTVPRIKILDRYVAVATNITKKGFIPSDSIPEFFDNNFDYLCHEAKIALPKLFEFGGYNNDSVSAINQELPMNPLYVRTVLMENEYGEIKPQTYDENIAWYKMERLRINFETPDKEI